MNDLHKYDTKTRQVYQIDIMLLFLLFCPKEQLPCFKNKMLFRTWTAVDAKGELPCPRSFHQMVSLNNKVFEEKKQAKSIFFLK